MFVTPLDQLSRLDRPASYFRTLIYLTSCLDPVQFRRIHASEIAEGSAQSKPSVWRSLVMLKKDNVIIATGENSRIAYRLNHNLCWASSAEKYAVITEEDRDPQIADLI